MKNITLISDWKLRDPYVAIFKAQLMNVVPDSHLFDLTHSIDLHDTQQTAFILKNSYSNFPKGTLHVILTNTLLAYDASPLLIEFDEHYFLGHDDGVFHLMFRESEKKMWAFPERQKESNVIERILTMMRWHYAQEITKKCAEIDSLVTRIQEEPAYFPLENKLTGQISYIDSYCNAVTNIPLSLFQESSRNRPFTMRLRPGITINQFAQQYDPKITAIYLVANRLSFIEITINLGRAAVLANLNIGDKIEIVFN